MIAWRGELLIDGWGRFGIVMQDVAFGKGLDRMILVFYDDYIRIEDITTRAWWRRFETGKEQNIFSGPDYRCPQNSAIVDNLDLTCNHKAKCDRITI